MCTTLQILISFYFITQIFCVKWISSERGLDNVFKKTLRKKGEHNIKKKNTENQSDSVRVSWKECNLENEFQKDCGYYGITEEECYKRECCWNDDKDDGSPWCYHSKQQITRKCTVEDNEREDCGFHGIRKDQCQHLGCCWQPSNEDGIPWCFNITLLEPQTGECGNPAISPSISGRIVGGETAIPHSWPWQVSLRMGGHFCGGSIINQEWIVSAGHCGYPGMDSVIIGMHSQTNASSSEREIGISKMITHESGFANDFMLLKLSEPIEFSDEVSPVCLPKQNEEFEAGGTCYTTGWGALMSGGGSPDELQQVLVPLIDRDICNQEDWYNGDVTENMICAGYEEGGRDSCQGDSGGPLVCLDHGKWKLVGVVSWGYGCAFVRKPGVYTKTSNSINWIAMKITDYS